MCGFFVTNDSLVNDSYLPVLNNRLSFRGPDFQSKLVRHGEWSLYHSRLSIIATESTYAQPYFTESGGVLVFNGEILNYKELSIKYGISDAKSDTSVLSILLEINSFNLNEIEGFFAFVFIDKNHKLIHCARDRFGVKPLVYYKDNKKISICSEASVLSDIYNLPYDNMALDEYKAFRAPIFSGSYFKGVNVIDPGCCLITGCYFDSLSFIPESFGKLDNLLLEVRPAIARSIDSRLIADVPVGLLFSGGIDSNLIKHCNKTDFECFTGGFKGDYDISYVDSIGSIKSNLLEITNEQFVRRFNDMVKLRKEPLSVPNEVVLSLLAEKWEEKGGKVLLSGEAADELFAGYDRIYGWALNAEYFDLDMFLRFYAYSAPELISEDIKMSLMEFFNDLKSLSVFEMVRQFFVKKHLPVLFRRLDFSLMYSGIEGREPLASIELYKLALKFNPTDLFKNSVGKYPLRYVATNLINKEFAFRSKVGFPVDLKEVFYGVSSHNRIENYSVWCDKNLEKIS